MSSDDDDDAVTRMFFVSQRSQPDATPKSPDVTSEKKATEVNPSTSTQKFNTDTSSKTRTSTRQTNTSAPISQSGIPNTEKEKALVRPPSSEHGQTTSRKDVLSPNESMKPATSSTTKGMRRPPSPIGKDDSSRPACDNPVTTLRERAPISTHPGGNIDTNSPSTTSCPSCKGKNLPIESIFCLYCGHRLVSTGNPASSTGASTAAKPIIPSQQTKPTMANSISTLTTTTTIALHPSTEQKATVVLSDAVDTPFLITQLYQRPIESILTQSTLSHSQQQTPLPSSPTNALAPPLSCRADPADEPIVEALGYPLKLWDRLPQVLRRLQAASSNATTVAKYLEQVAAVEKAYGDALAGFSQADPLMCVELNLAEFRGESVEWVRAERAKIKAARQVELNSVEGKYEEEKRLWEEYRKDLSSRAAAHKDMAKLLSLAAKEWVRPWAKAMMNMQTGIKASVSQAELALEKQLQEREKKRKEVEEASRKAAKDIKKDNKLGADAKKPIGGGMGGGMGIEALVQEHDLYRARNMYNIAVTSSLEKAATQLVAHGTMMRRVVLTALRAQQRSYEEGVNTTRMLQTGLITMNDLEATPLPPLSPPTMLTATSTGTSITTTDSIVLTPQMRRRPLAYRSSLDEVVFIKSAASGTTCPWLGPGANTAANALGKPIVSVNAPVRPARDIPPPQPSPRQATESTSSTSTGPISPTILSNDPLTSQSHSPEGNKEMVKESIETETLETGQRVVNPVVVVPGLPYQEATMGSNNNFYGGMKAGERERGNSQSMKPQTRASQEYGMVMGSLRDRTGGRGNQQQQHQQQGKIVMSPLYDDDDSAEDAKKSAMARLKLLSMASLAGEEEIRKRPDELYVDDGGLDVYYGGDERRGNTTSGNSGGGSGSGSNNGGREGTTDAGARGGRTLGSRPILVVSASNPPPIVPKPQPSPTGRGPNEVGGGDVKEGDSTGKSGSSYGMKETNGRRSESPRALASESIPMVKLSPNIVGVTGNIGQTDRDDEDESVVEDAFAYVSEVVVGERQGAEASIQEAFGLQRGTVAERNIAKKPLIPYALALLPRALPSARLSSWFPLPPLLATTPDKGYLFESLKHHSESHPVFSSPAASGVTPNQDLPLTSYTCLLPADLARATIGVEPGVLATANIAVFTSLLSSPSLPASSLAVFGIPPPHASAALATDPREGPSTWRPLPIPDLLAPPTTWFKPPAIVNAVTTPPSIYTPSLLWSLHPSHWRLAAYEQLLLSSNFFYDLGSPDTISQSTGSTIRAAPVHALSQSSFDLLNNATRVHLGLSSAMASSLAYSVACPCRPVIVVTSGKSSSSAASSIDPSSIAALLAPTLPATHSAILPRGITRTRLGEQMSYVNWRALMLLSASPSSFSPLGNHVSTEAAYESLFIPSRLRAHLPVFPSPPSFLSLGPGARGTVAYASWVIRQLTVILCSIAMTIANQRLAPFYARRIHRLRELTPSSGSGSSNTSGIPTTLPSPSQQPSLGPFFYKRLVRETNRCARAVRRAESVISNAREDLKSWLKKEIERQMILDARQARRDKGKDKDKGKENEKDKTKERGNEKAKGKQASGDLLGDDVEMSVSGYGLRQPVENTDEWGCPQPLHGSFTSVYLLVRDIAIKTGDVSSASRAATPTSYAGGRGTSTVPLSFSTSASSLSSTSSQKGSLPPVPPRRSTEAEEQQRRDEEDRVYLEEMLGEDISDDEDDEVLDHTSISLRNTGKYGGMGGGIGSGKGDRGWKDGDIDDDSDDDVLLDEKLAARKDQRGKAQPGRKGDMVPIAGRLLRYPPQLVRALYDLQLATILSEKEEEEEEEEEEEGDEESKATEEKEEERDNTGFGGDNDETKHDVGEGLASAAKTKVKTIEYRLHPHYREIILALSTLRDGSVISARCHALSLAQCAVHVLFSQQVGALPLNDIPLLRSLLTPVNTYSPALPIPSVRLGAGGGPLRFTLPNLRDADALESDCLYGPDLDHVIHVHAVAKRDDATTAELDLLGLSHASDFDPSSNNRAGRSTSSSSHMNSSLMSPSHLSSLNPDEESSILPLLMFAVTACHISPSPLSSCLIAASNPTITPYLPRVLEQSSSVSHSSSLTLLSNRSTEASVTPDDVHDSYSAGSIIAYLLSSLRHYHRAIALIDGDVKGKASSSLYANPTDVEDDRFWLEADARGGGSAIPSATTRPKLEGNDHDQDKSQSKAKGKGKQKDRDQEVEKPTTPADLAENGDDVTLKSRPLEYIHEGEVTARAVLGHLFTTVLGLLSWTGATPFTMTRILQTVSTTSAALGYDRLYPTLEPTVKKEYEREKDNKKTKDRDREETKKSGGLMETDQTTTLNMEAIFSDLPSPPSRLTSPSSRYFFNTSDLPARLPYAPVINAATGSALTVPIHTLTSVLEQMGVSTAMSALQLGSITDLIHGDNNPEINGSDKSSGLGRRRGSINNKDTAWLAPSLTLDTPPDVSTGFLTHRVRATLSLVFLPHFRHQRTTHRARCFMMLQPHDQAVFSSTINERIHVFTKTDQLIYRDVAKLFLIQLKSTALYLRSPMGRAAGLTAPVDSSEAIKGIYCGCGARVSLRADEVPLPEVDGATDSHLPPSSTQNPLFGRRAVLARLHGMRSTWVDGSVLALSNLLYDDAHIIYSSFQGGQASEAALLEAESGRPHMQPGASLPPSALLLEKEPVAPLPDHIIGFLRHGIQLVRRLSTVYAFLSPPARICTVLTLPPISSYCSSRLELWVQRQYARAINFVTKSVDSDPTLTVFKFGSRCTEIIIPSSASDVLCMVNFTTSQYFSFLAKLAPYGLSTIDSAILLALSPLHLYLKHATDMSGGADAVTSFRPVAYPGVAPIPKSGKGLLGAFRSQYKPPSERPVPLPPHSPASRLMQAASPSQLFARANAVHVIQEGLQSVGQTFVTAWTQMMETNQNDWRLKLLPTEDSKETRSSWLGTPISVVRRILDEARNQSHAADIGTFIDKAKEESSSISRPGVSIGEMKLEKGDGKGSKADQSEREEESKKLKKSKDKITVGGDATTTVGGTSMKSSGSTASMIPLKGPLSLWLTCTLINRLCQTMRDLAEKKKGHTHRERRNYPIETDLERLNTAKRLFALLPTAGPALTVSSFLRPIVDHASARALLASYHIAVHTLYIDLRAPFLHRAYLPTPEQGNFASSRKSFVSPLEARVDEAKASLNPSVYETAVEVLYTELMHGLLWVIVYGDRSFTPSQAREFVQIDLDMFEDMFEEEIKAETIARVGVNAALVVKAMTKSTDEIIQILDGMARKGVTSGSTSSDILLTNRAMTVGLGSSTLTTTFAVEPFDFTRPKNSADVAPGRAVYLRILGQRTLFDQTARAYLKELIKSKQIICSGFDDIGFASLQ